MFEIQITTPTKLAMIDPEDINVNEALQTIYSIDDNFTIFLGTYKKTGSLKGNFSEIWNEAVEMLIKLKYHNHTRHILEFPSQGYFGGWEIIVHEYTIEVIASWTPDEVDYKNNVIPYPSVFVDKTLFFKEWEKAITLTCKDLINQGYNLIELLDNYGYSIDEKKSFLRELKLIP